MQVAMEGSPSQREGKMHDETLASWLSSIYRLDVAVQITVAKASGSFIVTYVFTQIVPTFVII